MDRVTLLDLQECLQAATSTGERELRPEHLRVRAGEGKESRAGFSLGFVGYRAHIARIRG